MFCTDNVILHIVDKVFEAKIFIDNWCYNLHIGEQILDTQSGAILILCDYLGLKHSVKSSQGIYLTLFFMCLHMCMYDTYNMCMYDTYNMCMYDTCNMCICTCVCMWHCVTLCVCVTLCICVTLCVCVNVWHSVDNIVCFVIQCPWWVWMSYKSSFRNSQEKFYGTAWVCCCQEILKWHLDILILMVNVYRIA